MKPCLGDSHCCPRTHIPKSWNDDTPESMSRQLTGHIMPAGALDKKHQQWSGSVWAHKEDSCVLQERWIIGEQH